MIEVSDQQFEELIGQALDELPPEYVKRLLKDAAVTWADEPSPEQITKLKLRHDQSLLGLYEGLPLTQRYSGITKLEPDKITIFKGPICRQTDRYDDLKNQIKKTVWHEMAHFFGLGHDRIHELGG